MRSTFSNAIQVLKQDTNDNDYICREHEAFDPECPKCRNTKKSRRDLIEDSCLYATQLYATGVKEYINSLKNNRDKRGLNMGP